LLALRSFHDRRFDMGLLDSILGGIAQNALGRSGGLSGLGGLGRSGGQSNVLMALLPLVLAMLSNRKGSAGGIPGLSGSAAGGALGGLAGLGGIGALLDRFQQKGHGDEIQSWIGTGENRPIPPDALSDVFDRNELSQLASQAGLTEDEARVGLSALLPQIVDQLTPEGRVPDDDQLRSRIGELEGELQQQRA
jgi:uncharacterized protein YidB (DUF937 family)